MMIEHTIEIQAPASVVWALTIDVDGLPGVTPTVKSVRRLEVDRPISVGSQVELKQPMQRPSVWTVTRLEEPESFEWVASVFGLTMTARHQITALSPTTCSNTLAVDISGRGASLPSKVLKPVLAKALAQENEGFKQAAESNR